MPVAKTKPQPLDSFRVVFATLVCLGCYKLQPEPSKRWILYLHYFYRCLFFTCLIFMNVQEVVYIILYSDLDTAINTMSLQMPLINHIVKFLTLYLRTSRIDKLHQVMNGPYFSAKSDKDEEYMKKNEVEMNRLMTLINIGVSICAAIWVLSYYVKRIQQEEIVVPLILPFNMSTWFGFTLSVFAMVGFSSSLGVSHMALDCLVATYYAQAKTQLKILKHSLEHMFDDEERALVAVTSREEKDNKFKERFIFIVHKYENIAWFIKEVNSVFYYSMSFQFLTATAISCFVIYSMSNEPRSSAQFMFLALLLYIFQIQVFLYCYYGSLVEFESQSVNQSAFMSDWVSLSPSFRRSLLIAMTRWTRPHRIMVAGIIPLSIATFITMARSAYTLFTVLSQTD